MVRKIIVLVFTALIFQGFQCKAIINEMTGERIEGSGNIITKNLDLSEFNSVNFSTAGKVYVKQGNNQSVSLSVDDNIMEYIVAEVKSGKFHIGKESEVRLKDFKLEVRITMRDLESLSTSSAGDIIGEGKFTADDVRFSVSSAGDMTIEIDAETIETNLSSAGDFRISGSAKTHDVTVSSAGDLKAFDLITESTTVGASSAGDAEVYATKTLNASISSAGSVYYKGDPKTSVSRSSAGRLIKK
ncbi:head GIN domain-containing protein [candidate division KSB1 bacterium]